MLKKQPLLLIFNFIYVALFLNLIIFTFPQIVSDNILAPLFIIYILISCFIIHKFFNKFWSINFNYIVPFICLTAFAFMVYAAVNNVYIPLKGDYEAIYTAIKELNENGHFTLSVEYYLLYPHQLFSTFIYSIVNRVFMLLGSGVAVSPLYTSVFNCLLTAVGICFATYAAKMLFTVKFAYSTLIILLSHISYYTANARIYPHALSVFFLGLILLAFALFETSLKYKKLFCVFLGISFALGCSVEGIFNIGVVAIVIYIFLKYNFKNFIINTALILASFAITLFLINLAYTSFNLFNNTNTNNESLPYEHWLMMGFSENGEFQEADFQTSFMLDTTDKRAEYARQEILNRIQSRTPSELYTFIMGKQQLVWQGLNYGFNLTGNANELIFAFRLMLITGLFLSVILNFKSKDISPIKFFEIWAVGIILFICIWEASAYYLYSSILMLAIPACNGYISIFKRINN